MSKGKQEEKIKSHYNTKDYYKFYKENNFGNNTESKFHMSPTKYTQILKDFFDEMMMELVLTGEEFIIPYNMGKLQIRKEKSEIKIGEDGKIVNRLPVDYGATNKLWDSNPEAKEKKILVRHLNKHTNGYIFKIKYIKYRARYKNKSVYTFKATRTHNRNLTKLINKFGKKLDFLKLY